MIQNIVVLMSMIYGRGGIDITKAVIAYFGAVLIVSIMAYAIGYLYDGIKNGVWSFNYESGSIIKRLGFMVAVCDIAVAACAGMFYLIYSLL